jgi:hypothetical protein
MTYVRGDRQHIVHYNANGTKMSRKDQRGIYCGNIRNGYKY